MNPRLVGIAGPSPGKVFSLGTEDFWIGRDPLSHIHLTDTAVSRRHCVIRQEGDAFTLRDDGAKNGTWVNEERLIGVRRLAHGDVIGVGDSLFRFLTEADDPSSLQPSSFFAKRTTLTLKQEDVLYLRPEELEAQLAESPGLARELMTRVARDLNTLLMISNQLRSTQRLPELRRRLLESVVRLVAADRGAVVLTDYPRENGQEGDSIFRLDRDGGTASGWPISQTVLNHVLQSGETVLMNDYEEVNPELRGANSFSEENIKTVLAAPLTARHRILGVLYLDKTDAAIQFNRYDLQLITAIAAITGAMFDNAIYIEELERATRKLDDENQRLQEEVHGVRGMIGDSPRLSEVRRFISKVAPSDYTVLIRGESGTGKEIAAREIHQQSPRRDRAFVAINCAAIPETLLESELLGYAKGAFTGADRPKMGKLEAADGGTLFLDEIGEMGPALQSKILRVLQEREFERVGSNTPTRVDLRVIAATNRDLEAMIREGSFREDLYFRLKVLQLEMPPLRERRDDILRLAGHFLKQGCDQQSKPAKNFSPEAQKALLIHDWPGNVRELENAVKRALVMSESEMIVPRDLFDKAARTPAAPHPPSLNRKETERAIKRQTIIDALERSGGNVSEAARLLGYHNTHLSRLINELDLVETRDRLRAERETRKQK
jgi:Nif-specific regulatory protein